MFRTRGNSPIGDLASWVHPRFSLFPETTMHHLFKNKNKRKKSPEPPQPGIPTDIADRPPGFPTELGIGSQGEWSLLSGSIDCPDSTVALDEGSRGGSRITFQDKEGGNQGLTAPKASTSGGVAHGTDLGYDRMCVCVCSLRLGQGSCGSLFFSPPGVDTDDTEGRESKPVEGLRGMCR